MALNLFIIGRSSFPDNAQVLFPTIYFSLAASENNPDWKKIIAIHSIHVSIFLK